MSLPSSLIFKNQSGFQTILYAGVAKSLNRDNLPTLLVKSKKFAKISGVKRWQDKEK